MSNFCSAPFIHMYVHSNEGQQVCCMSTENNLLDDNLSASLAERWTSDYYKKIRKQFIDNEQPSICTKCFTLEKTGGTSDRMRFNDLYLKSLEPNIETGNQYNTPVDLDIRPGNLCNLRCRMCGPVSSSQLQKEIFDNKFLVEILGSGTIRSSDVLERDENIEFLLKNANHSKRIKFLGGEPTIMPEVDKFLDILIERELFDVPLHFTTNCTNGNKRFIDKITKFNQISFNYSVDGVGSVVEYIRDPVKFKSINNNIQTYHNIAVAGEITFTLQAYNFFNLPDIIEWANSLGIYVRPEILMVPNWASYKSIPLKIRNKRISVMNKLMKNYKHEQIKKLEPVLLIMYNDDEEYDLKNFVKSTKLFDKSRNQHIKNYIPEVWEIIKGDYDALQI